MTSLPTGMFLKRSSDRGEKPVCFCQHCRDRARAAGTHVDRAVEGYRRLYALIDGLKTGAKSRPSDGVLVSVMRLFLKYPEILAWERHWQESKEEAAKLMFGAIKQVAPQAEVGWHIDHQQTTWDAVYRAGMDYGDQAEYSDFLKLCVYHDVAGPRVRRWYLDRVAETVLSELSLEQSLGLLYAVMGLDGSVEPSLEQMDEKGFSTGYIRHEVARAVEAAAGKSKIYAGIAFDVPFGPQGANWKHFSSDPEQVRASVLAAIEAGADGVVASREYDEMRIPNLEAFGKAVREAESGGA